MFKKCGILKSREVFIMFNIKDYIKQNETLKNLDFMTVYLTIVELCKDGKLEMKENV